MTRLDRYLLGELWDHFLLALVLFSLIAFFSDSLLAFIQAIQKLGLPLDTALTLVGLQLPKTIALVLPASVFLAVLLVYSQMNGTFQLTAFRTHGISLARITGPALWLGLAGTLMAYALNDFVVPTCNRLTQQIQTQALQAGNLPGGRQSVLFYDYDDAHRLRQLVYVGKTDGHRLGDSTILDLSRPGVLQVIQAGGGEWFPGQWVFRNANAYTISTTNDLLVFNHLESVRLNRLMTPDDEADVLGAGDSLEARLNVKAGNLPFAPLLANIQLRQQHGFKVSHKTAINLWEKLTLPLSCLVIVLSAVPLSMTSPRASANRGFLFAIAMLFLYYLLRSVFVALGRAGTLTFGGVLDPVAAGLLAAGLPIVLMALLGVGLLYRKSRVLG